MVRLRIYKDHIQSEALVTDADASVLVTFQVKNFNVIAGANTQNVFSYEIDIPEGINRLALDSIIDINSTNGRELRGKTVRASIDAPLWTSDGSLVFKGYDMTDGVAVVKAQFVAGMRNIFEDLPENLCDLDMGIGYYGYSFPDGIDTVKDDNNPYDGTYKYWFPLVYYGDDASATDHIPSDYLKPAIYSRAIIDTISETGGFTIDSKVFNSEYFKRLVHPYTCEDRENIRIQGFVISNDNDLIGVDTQNIFLNNNFIPYTVSNPIPLGINTMGQIGISFTDSATLTHSFFASNVTTFSYAYVTINRGGVFIISNAVQVQNGQNDFVINLDLQEGDIITINNDGNFDIQAGGSWILEWSDLDNGLIENAFFYIGTALPCYPIKDYLVDLSVLHNLVYFYDQRRNRLIAEPKWDCVLTGTGEAIGGFYGNKFEARDITEYIDCEKESGTFQFSDYKRFLTFQYCEDSNDELIASTLYQHRETLNSNYPTGTTTIETSLLAPTLFDTLPSQYVPASPTATPIVPWIVKFGQDDDDKGVSCKGKMRIAYKVGNVIGNWLWKTNANDPGVFPYATMRDNALGINLGFDSFSNVNGIVETYYRTDITNSNDGIKKVVSVNSDAINLNDLQGLFSTPVTYNSPYTGKGTYLVERATRVNIAGTAKIDLELISI